MDLEVTLYTRQNCKLCDQAEKDFEEIQSDIPHKLVIVDIDLDPNLVAVYGHRAPVVSVGPFTLEAPFDQRKLRMTLAAAKDSHTQRLEDRGDRYL